MVFLKIRFDLLSAFGQTFGHATWR